MSGIPAGIKKEIRIGVYICHCGTNIAGVIDVSRVADYASRLDNVAVSRHYSYMCSDPGQALIISDIKEYTLDRVIVASCSPLMHEDTFRLACSQGGLNPYMFQMTNLREHVAWVVDDQEFATEKAMNLVSGAVKRIHFQEKLDQRRHGVRKSALVVGAGISGMEAALRLADAGVQVYLVEKQPGIGGHMAQLFKTFPTLDCAA